MVVGYALGYELEQSVRISDQCSQAVDSQTYLSWTQNASLAGGCQMTSFPATRSLMMSTFACLQQITNMERSSMYLSIIYFSLQKTRIGLSPHSILFG
jgi:hypothetical protein